MRESKSNSPRLQVFRDANVVGMVLYFLDSTCASVSGIFGPARRSHALDRFRFVREAAALAPVLRFGSFDLVVLLLVAPLYSPSCFAFAAARPVCPATDRHDLSWPGSFRRGAPPTPGRRRAMPLRPRIRGRSSSPLRPRRYAPCSARPTRTHHRAVRRLSAPQ
jgi:hypothetical protein